MSLLGKKNEAGDMQTLEMCASEERNSRPTIIHKRCREIPRGLCVKLCQLVPHRILYEAWGARLNIVRSIQCKW